MTVAELIKELKKFDKNLQTEFFSRKYGGFDIKFVEKDYEYPVVSLSDEKWDINDQKA